MRAPRVTYGKLPTGAMPKLDLPPEEILEGTPNARLLLTADVGERGASAGFWSCDVGRYEFAFDYDEFIYVVEGEVAITDCRPGGPTRTLGPGDTAHFPTGCKTIWQITKKLTKYFVALS